MPFLRDVLPEFTEELALAMEGEGLAKLASSIRDSQIADRCRCEIAGCATFHALRKGHLPAPGVCSRVVAPIPGVYCVQYFNDQLVRVEALDRPKERGLLDAYESMNGLVSEPDSNSIQDRCDRPARPLRYCFSQSARRILIAAIIAFAAIQSAFLIWFTSRRLSLPVQLGPDLYQPMAALCLVLFNTLVAIWFYHRWKVSHVVIDLAAGTLVLPTGRGFSLAHVHHVRLYRLPVVGALYVVVHNPSRRLAPVDVNNSYYRGTLLV